MADLRATVERSPGRQRFLTVAVVSISLVCLSSSAIAQEAGSSPVSQAVVADPIAEPAGYRLEDYRSPTPAGLAGAQVVKTDEAKALWASKGAVFVDVLPRVPRPKDLPKTTVWRPKPRHDIPGSLWFVDTGYGSLAPMMERYFLDGLAHATGGDMGRPLVFYCLRDCWMSWNAAKRALAAGYRAVLWYREGTDGWSEAGLPTELREPQARPDE